MKASSAEGSALRERLEASRRSLMDAIAAAGEGHATAHALEQAFRTRPAPGEWGVAHVLAHLYIVECTLLDGPGPHDKDDVDPEATLVRQMTVPQLLHGLVAQRRLNLEKVEALAAKGHVSRALFESFAQHEESHAEQIRALSKQPIAEGTPAT